MSPTKKTTKAKAKETTTETTKKKVSSSTSKTKKKASTSAAKKTAVRKTTATKKPKRTATATTAKTTVKKKSATAKKPAEKKTKKTVSKPKAETKKEIEKTIPVAEKPVAQVKPTVKVETPKTKPEPTKSQDDILLEKELKELEEKETKLKEEAKKQAEVPKHETKKTEPKPVKEEKPKRPVIKTTGQPTVRELAEKMEMRVNDFIKKLIGMGIFATINQRLESDIATLVTNECGFDLEIVPMYAEDKLDSIVEKEESKENLQHRPPVVTIMGHVDHGKTSLLDAIRSSNVCSTEKGEITQHIGAYKVCVGNKGDITFLDTPGHEAFTAMRARGAQVTDIVILVVSATDSVMPQTIEAIDHAKAAGAPIIVAVNKIDLPGADVNKVKQDLSSSGLVAEDWGGNTVYVEISAKRRINIDKLLEIVLLQAELMELKANPNAKGVGTILEAKRDQKRGNVATVLIKSGNMKVGDPFVVGTSSGRIRALVDEYGERLKVVKPSHPAEILGISGDIPQVGDILYVLETEKEARKIADERRLAKREESLAHKKHVSLLELRNQITQSKLKTLQIILKGDVQGSVQAIRDSLERISTEEVEVRIIHSGIGNVNESDILLAKASDAIVMAFHVAVESNAETEATRAGIEVRKYDIIFELLEDVKAAMEGLLEPEIIEKTVGKADVKQVFDLSSGTIAGSFVTEGKFIRGNEAKVLRGGELFLKGRVSGLKRFKEDVKEVAKGYECGILIEGYKQIQPGDIIECIEKETKTRRIEINNG
jgi:translation initiation factor IF-2